MLHVLHKFIDTTVAATFEVVNLTMIQSSEGDPTELPEARLKGFRSGSGTGREDEHQHRNQRGD